MLKERWAAFWRWADLDASDAHAYGGLALMTAGLWMYRPPLAFVVAGAVLIFFALRTAR